MSDAPHHSHFRIPTGGAEEDVLEWLQVFQEFVELGGPSVHHGIDLRDTNVLFKESFASEFVQKVQANPFETSSTDHIVFWADLEIALIALALFILTVKLLSLLRFNRHICQMSGTLKLSAKEMVSFSSVFVILILAFSQLAFLVFGDNVAAYFSVLASVRSLLLKLIGGRMYLADTTDVNPGFSRVFTFLYMCSMLFAFVNMFCAILCECHEQVKGQRGKEFPDTELGEFMSDHILKKMKDTVSAIAESFKGRNLRTEEYTDNGYEKVMTEDLEQSRMTSVINGFLVEEDAEEEEGLAEVLLDLSASAFSSLRTLSGDDEFLCVTDLPENARTIWDRLY